MRPSAAARAAVLGAILIATGRDLPSPRQRTVVFWGGGVHRELEYVKIARQIFGDYVEYSVRKVRKCITDLTKVCPPRGRCETIVGEPPLAMALSKIAGIPVDARCYRTRVKGREYRRWKIVVRDEEAVKTLARWAKKGRHVVVSMIGRFRALTHIVLSVLGKTRSTVLDLPKKLIRELCTDLWTNFERCREVLGHRRAWGLIRLAIAMRMYDRERRQFVWW